MIDDTQIQEPEVQEQEVSEEVTAPIAEEPKPQQPVQPPQETDGERNFRMLRQEKARVDQENAALAQKIRDLETRQEENAVTLGEEDIVEGKHLNSVRKDQIKLRQELKAAKEEMALMTLESRIKARYPDFEEVFTKENISKLDEQYPELTSSLTTDPDKFKQAVNTYTLIKKLGINERDPYMEDKQKIQENSMKPRSVASLSPQQGGHPLEKANAFANGLTPELSKQLWKEMQSYAKGRI